PAQPYGVFTADSVPAAEVPHTAVLPDGTRVRVPAAPAHPAPGAPPEPPEPGPPGVPAAPAHPAPGAPPEPPEPGPPAWAGPTTRAPLGRVAGARSGDKGGDANIGVWTESDDAWAWLRRTLTTGALRALLPETAGLPVTRHVLPELRALNFTITGILGEGVASAHRFDPQGKALGEWLRARHLDIPDHLLSAPEGTGS
ncbi:AtuA-related protein, partial [Streptomyces sp. NPDC054838]